MKLKFKMRKATSADWYWAVDSSRGLVAAGHESKLKDAIEEMSAAAEAVLKSEFSCLKEEDD